jgi:hypothetical protein
MNFKNVLLLLVVMVSLLVGGCKYDWILPVEAPDEPVSFSQDILPVFSEKNCTACHDGSPAPDLSEENAYSAVNTASYINSTSPAESRIYTVPHPNGAHPVKYSAVQAALVLAWIEQGAQDN